MTVIPSKELIDELHSKVNFFISSHGVKIAYRIYGDPNGAPIIFYHGTGSHIHAMLLHEDAIKLNFKIIVPTRPGIGDSDFRKWSVLDFARDMEDLADYLKHDKFGIMGISGGGPTLMASALRFPERLICVINLACAAPLYGDPEMQDEIGFTDRIFAKLANALPLGIFRIFYSILGFSQKILKSPKTFVKMFKSSLCEADQELFQNPDFQYLFMRDFQESFKNGSKGPSYDAQRIVQKWGFDISEIKAHVDIFQGYEDLFVPVKFTNYYRDKLESFNYFDFPGEGHFYTLVNAKHTLSLIKEMYYS